MLPSYPQTRPMQCSSRRLHGGQKISLGSWKMNPVEQTRLVQMKGSWGMTLRGGLSFIHHLQTHTSGLRRMFRWGIMRNKNLDRIFHFPAAENLPPSPALLTDPPSAKQVNATAMMEKAALCANAGSPGSLIWVVRSRARDTSACIYGTQS